jgi:glutamate synthase (NADPH/NADH) small chain
MLKKDRSEAEFEDYKAAYTDAQAKIEADRCLYCSDAPCMKACPTHIDIPQFIRKIATGNVEGAARTIFEANIHGMSCSRVCPVEVLCVGDCVYNEEGVPPIQIGKLQRHATDLAYQEDWQFFSAGAPTGKSVGLLGGGPASLACAHELRRLGHACTIYDRRPLLGGLNTTGVAPYKMRADASLAEVEWILKIGGIEHETAELGRDLGWAELEQAHDALFIGLGLGADSRLGIPGETRPGVHGAVAYIEELKLGTVDLGGVKHAVVVGGGNTAIDAVRELKGLGVHQVTMMYRGTAAGMSGYQHEWQAASHEGVQIMEHSLPLGFEGPADQGPVHAIRVTRVGVDKRPIPGSEHVVEAQLVLLAIGQARLGELMAGLEGIVLDKGRIVVDDDGRTGRAKYFSGGDCANGGKEVVNASAEGKRAAQAIHAQLTGQPITPRKPPAFPIVAGLRPASPHGGSHA